MSVAESEPSPSLRYYDLENRRLVYIGKAATPEMWDALWTENERLIHDSVGPSRGTRWLVKLTNRYLPAGTGRILEGGCGPGHNVAALRRAGHEVVGLDSARETVVSLRRSAPELNVLLGDLRELPFPDDAFAGYWSLGVIEHFFDGFGAIAEEMARVIRPGGYLFLTFPFMSPLRRLRARLGGYRELQMQGEPPDFYQFALDATHVAREFERLGFRKCFQSSKSGLQGFKDEVPLVQKPLQWLHDYGGRSVLVRGTRFLMEGLVMFGAGHSCIQVFQKCGR